MDGWINFVESMTEGTNERMNGRIIERGDESKNATMNKYRTDVMTDQRQHPLFFCNLRHILMSKGSNVRFGVVFFIRFVCLFVMRLCVLVLGFQRPSTAQGHFRTKLFDRI